jgi:hypothetical protein
VLLMTITSARRAVLTRRVRLLVAATISYNVVEAAVALAEGARVSSTALIGFGLDSVIEVSSAAAVAWQFAGADPERREKVALRVVAGSFFGLAAYVTVEALRALIGAERPEHRRFPSGSAWACSTTASAVIPENDELSDLSLSRLVSESPHPRGEDERAEGGQLAPHS